MTVANRLISDNFFDPALAQRQPLATAFLSSAILKGRLSHAYLFTGRATADRENLALQLAAFLNCTKRQPVASPAASFLPSHLSCQLFFAGREMEKVFLQFCQNCRWILEKKHPQALIRLSQEGSKAGKISVDKARQLIGELSKESAYTRVILVEDASQEIFHRPAANAVLKTIESPRTPCLFCFFALTEEDVLPTVVSRCQVVPLRRTEHQIILLADSAGRGTMMPIAEAESRSSLLSETQSIWQELQALKGTALANASLGYLEASRKIQTLSSDYNTADIIDILTEMEIARLGKQAVNSPLVSKYLSKLVTLGEDAKLQIAQFVAVKSVIESFCLSWWQLKNSSQLW